MIQKWFEMGTLRVLRRIRYNPILGYSGELSIGGGDLGRYRCPVVPVRLRTVEVYFHT